MKLGQPSSFGRRLRRAMAFVALTALPFGGIVLAQKNSAQPQPRADQLPPVNVPSPSRGVIVDKPAEIMPIVPAGFTVSLYAEIQGPRMMVYAPNGDLFVSSPSTNTITVLRDANNDGTFEQRGVYAQGDPPPARGGGPGQAVGPQRPAPGAQVNPAQNGPVLGANAPPCTPPPAFHNPGPGTVAAPFGMAFSNGYLYVGNTGSLVRFKYANGDLQGPGRAREAARPARGRPLDPQRHLQPRRHEDVRHGRIAVEQQRGRGLPARGGARVQPGRLGISRLCLRPAQPCRTRRCSRAPTRSGRRSTSATTWATTSCPTTPRRSRTAGSTGGRIPTSASTPIPRYVGAFPDLVNRALVPDVLIPSHSAALGITFYTGTQFPQRYRNGGFVALHGSWNRSVASGYKVAFFPMNNGRPGPLEDFADRLPGQRRRRRRHDRALGTPGRRHDVAATAACSSPTTAATASGRSALRRGDARETAHP